VALSGEAPAVLRAVVLMNPRSGGGKVGHFALVERARRLGARVSLLVNGQDAGALARRAVDDGADVLGVAGGDGTVSTVAAVAAQANLPLVVVPAGTRNHFARDLGLDIRNPASALDALRDGELVRVDLGRVEDRTFVNNVSFGVYADALLDPHYREAKARAMASVAGPYVAGRQWVEARVDTPAGTVERPQVVLLSNNPYHIATPRYLGRRFMLDRGVLGGIVLKRSAGSPPEPLPRLLRTLAEQGAAGRAGDDVITWSATHVTLNGAAEDVAAGVDGEAVRLPLPLTCEILPRALQVLLPRHRPGVPREPAVPRPPRRRPHAG
jgi:diacylglycerol kinase family enzyme